MTLGVEEMAMSKNFISRRRTGLPAPRYVFRPAKLHPGISVRKPVDREAPYGVMSSIAPRRSRRQEAHPLEDIVFAIVVAVLVSLILILVCHILEGADHPVPLLDAPIGFYILSHPFNTLFSLY